MRWTATRAQAHARGLVAATVLALALAATHGIAPTQAASTTESTVVTAEVLSATNLDVATACATGTSDVTDFGQLMPGTDNVTGSDCTVTFGSSNDTSMLRAHQPDGVGSAMYGQTRGTLDPGFNGGSPYQVASGGFFFYPVRSITQADGLPITVAHSEARRFLEDGSLDPAWGTAGIAADADFPGNNNTTHSVALQDDGKLLIGGIGGGGTRVTVARLLTNGTADTDWAGDGYWDTYDLCSCVDSRVGGLGVDSQGRVLASTHDGAGDAVIFRLLPDGTLDSSWGAAGVLTVAGAHDINDQFTSLIVLDNDDLLLATSNAGDVEVRRYDDTGTLVPGFGTAGVATIDFGATAFEPTDIGLQPGGSILVPSNRTGHLEARIIRLTPAGGLDGTYGTAGISDNPALGLSNREPQDAVFHPDGSVTIASYGWVAGDWAAELIRIDPAGQLDTTLGTNGTLMVHTGGLDTRWYTATGLPDGDVLAGGRRDAAEDTYVTRYDGISVPNYLDGTTDWDDSVAPNDVHFGACLQSVAGAGVNASWTTTGSCGTSDADPWNAIDADGTGPNAKIAESTTSGTTTAQAGLRFGFRTAGDQPAGSYIAPIIFEAAAPNV